jgi:hypothetical protein
MLLQLFEPFLEDMVQPLDQSPGRCMLAAKKGFVDRSIGSSSCYRRIREVSNWAEDIGLNCIQSRIRQHARSAMDDDGDLENEA